VIYDESRVQAQRVDDKLRQFGLSHADLDALPR